MIVKLVRDRTRRFRRRVRKNLMLRGSREEVFSRIYRRNSWGSRESRSGQGSEVHYTENLRLELPNLIEAFRVAHVLDAPCGDFNWMRHVISGLNVNYVGGDIVKALVRRNNEIYGSETISFRHMDITRDPLPASDLMIVRDCLFHFSYKDICLFLENFCRANIDLLLTTTHLGPGENSDIRTGDWRMIYLFDSPFCFPGEPLRRIADYVPPHPPRELCLFTKAQAVVALEHLSETRGI